jgi:hypothetical protein
MNVEHDMYDYTSKIWSHQNSNKSLTNNLEATPGKDSIDSLQKTPILGTSCLSVGMTIGSRELPGRKGL